MKVIFKCDSFSFPAEFDSSQTAKEIIQKLPLESTVSTWGQEIYFDIGFKASAEGATMKVKSGDIAYWPQGKCLCIFFGPTPASTTEDPIPASPVVLVGHTQANKEGLRAIELGEKISLELSRE